MEYFSQVHEALKIWGEMEVITDYVWIPGNMNFVV